MKYRLVCILVVMGLLVGILASCGGGGGTAAVSPFAGQWVGPWVDAANRQSGTLNVTIGTDGSISGSIHNSTLGQDGTAGGSVGSNGHVKGVFTYPGAVYTSSGTVVVNGSGHLVGTLQTYFNGVLNGSSAVDLTKQ